MNKELLKLLFHLCDHWQRPLRKYVLYQPIVIS